MSNKAGEPNRLFYGFCRRLLLLCLRIKLPIKVYGLENIPRSGGVLMASNHASYLDPPLVGSPIKSRMVRFMARDTLFKNRVISWIYYNIGVVPLSRDRGDVGAIKLAIQMLKSGQCVALFPEGTRTLDGNLQPAKNGIGFLIYKAGVPVVPVYIAGSYESFPKGAKSIRRHPISIHYGKPIPQEELTITGTDEKPDFEAISRLVMDRIASLKPATKH